MNNLNIDSNLVMAIIAVIALISPAITCLINNYFQTKRENMQNYEICKKQALNNFINSWIACCKTEDISTNDKLEYYRSLNCLYIYFKNVPSIVNQLFAVKNHYRLEHLSFIVSTLSRQIKKK